MTQSRLPRLPLLKELRDLRPEASTVPHDGRPSGQPRVRVILVPDAPNSSNVSLAESSWGWTRPIIEEAGYLGTYYQYHYPSEKREAEVWQHLSDVGDTLLDELLQLQRQESGPAPPVIIMSYGFGGVPMKKASRLQRLWQNVPSDDLKAVTRLSDRLYDRVALSLWEKLVLIVNIGCPHPTINKRQNWSLTEYVLRNDRRMEWKAIRAASNEVAILANLCSKFSEAGITCDLITTFETFRTSVRVGRNVLKRERRILVDRDLAETGVLNERLVSLDLASRSLQSLSPASACTDFKLGLVSTVKRTCSEGESTVASHAPGTSTTTANIFESTASELSHADDPVPHRPASPPVSAKAVDSGRKSKLPYYNFGRHPRNPGFYGRSEVMNAMDDALLPRLTEEEDVATINLQCFAICGLGGMGKTQIALEYAFSRRSKFQAIFWIQSDKRTSIAESFATVATGLGIAGISEASDLAISFSIVLKWLTDPTAQAHWLMIYDNVDDMNLISDFWPSLGKGSVLITGRDPSIMDYSRDCGVTLKPLSLPAAMELFCGALYKDIHSHRRNDTELRELLERFGGIPLAIVQVASFIHRRRLTIKEFKRKLEDGLQATGLAEYRALDPDGSYHQSLFTVWAFESLAEPSQSLLNTMALLNVFNIRENILRASQSLDDDPGSYPTQENDYIDARFELIKSSLVIRNLDLEQVELHPLVRDVLIARMEKSLLEICFTRAVRLVHGSWPSQTVKWGHETSHREQAAHLVSHSLQLKTLLESRSLEVSKGTELIWIELLKDSGWYLLERGEHDASRPLFLAALQLARQRSVEKPALVADVLMSLSALGLHISTPAEVLEYAQEHFSIRQKIFDSFDETPPLQVQYDLAMGWATVALAYNYAGRFEESEPNSVTALEMYRSFDLYQNWDQVPYFAVAHMGWTLWSLDRHDEAEKVLMEAVDADTQRNKSGSYGLASVLVPLGNAQTSLRKYDEACDTHEKALEIFFNANGNNYKTAQARFKVGEHYVRQGRLREADQQFQIAMSSFENNKHYQKEFARTLVHAARCQEMQGNLNSAVELFTKAQRVLDHEAIPFEAKKISDDELTKIVKLWSR